MKSLRPDVEDAVVRSQFVDDFLKSGLDWADYAHALENWPETLRVLWGVEAYDYAVDPQKEAYTFARSIIPEMNRLREQDRARREKDYLTRDRRSPAVEHDARVLAQIITLRSEPGSPHPGPFFLTFDNVVAAASEALRNQFGWDVGPAIQPRSWLNYLLAFTPAQIDASRRREVAKALIGLASWPTRGPLTVQEYAKLVAPKVGLKDTDADVLVAAFTKSPLLPELEKALEAGEGSRADHVTEQIIGDRPYIETIAGSKRQKEVITALRARLDLVEAENRRLRQTSPAPWSTSAPPTVVVNVTNVPSASATATSTSNASLSFEAQLDSLISQLGTLFPGGLSSVGLPPAPENRKDAPGVKGWLKAVFDKISDTGGVFESARNLLPTIALLLSLVPH